MVAKTGRTDRANLHTPIWKPRSKHSAPEFQSIQQFCLQLDIVSEREKNKPKNADAQVWSDARGDQKPETLLA